MHNMIHIKVTTTDNYGIFSISPIPSLLELEAL